MDFQKPLDELEDRVSKVKTSVRTAAAETNEQLNEHVAKVQANTERELDEAKQHAGAAADRTRTGWEQMRADAKARAAELKTKARVRRERHDADVAASDADVAEAEASAPRPVCLTNVSGPAALFAARNRCESSDTMVPVTAVP